MPNKHQIVIVVWDDAWGGAHNPTLTHEIAAGHKPITVTTVGWLLQNDERGVTLFNERYMDDGEDYWRGRSFIPRGMVKSVTPFNLARPRKKKDEDRPPDTDDST